MPNEQTSHVVPFTKFRSVVEERSFQYLLRLETEKAARLRYCVSVVCLTPDAPADDKITQRLAEAAIQCFRATDVVTTLSPAAIGLLLVDAEPRDLPGIFSRTTLALDMRTLMGGAERAPVTWSAGGSCYPVTTTNREGLLQQAGDLMNQARHAGGGRLCLPVKEPG